VVPTGNGIPVPANGGGTEGKLHKTEHRRGSEQRPGESANIALQSETAKNEDANLGNHRETA